MLHRLLKVCWIIPLVVLLLVCGTSQAVAPTHTRLAHADAAFQKFASVSGQDFSRFAHFWVAHSAALSFSENGQALLIARTYTWCGSGVVSPCDTIDAGGYIHSGYREQVQFVRVSGMMAYGTVIASNFQPVGTAIMASLQRGDTLLYSSSTQEILLCGPGASAGTCGA